MYKLDWVCYVCARVFNILLYFFIIINMKRINFGGKADNRLQGV